MPRSIWSGAISFGLVNVPVKLVTAISNKEIRFHQLHDQDGGRIQYRRVCSVDGEEVPFEHVVKGYPLSPDRDVVLRPEELEALAPEKSHAIAVEDFVKLEEIDPLYWEHSYYLLPERNAAKPYRLLVEAMRNTGRVAVARMVLRSREYLCTIRPLEDGLVLSTMQYADEVIPVSQLPGLPKASNAPGKRELELAEQLIASLSRSFQPERYQDRYRARVEALIAKKEEGQALVVHAPEAAPAQVVDLMEALKASLAESGHPVAEGERRHADAAARRRTRRTGKKR